MAMYFFIPFYGLRIAMENYLMEGELELSDAPRAYKRCGGFNLSDGFENKDYED